MGAISGLNGVEVSYMHPNAGLGDLGDVSLSFPEGSGSIVPPDTGTGLDWGQWGLDTPTMPISVFGTGGGGFDWGSLFTPIVQSGTRVFESIYTPKPVYQTSTGPGGQSQTTLWSNLTGGLTLPGATVGAGSLLPLALIGVGLFVVAKMFDGKH